MTKDFIIKWWSMHKVCWNILCYNLITSIHFSLSIYLHSFTSFSYLCHSLYVLMYRSNFEDIIFRQKRRGRIIIYIKLINTEVFTVFKHHKLPIQPRGRQLACLSEQTHLTLQPSADYLATQLLLQPIQASLSSRTIKQSSLRFRQK